jgi:hypothetical protein
VAFFAAAFFAGAFLVVALAAPEVVFCLLTRPELVFFRTVGTSWTAGAGVSFLVALALVDGALLVAVLALGFAAVLVLGAAFALVVLVAAFFVAVLALVTFGLLSVFSFWRLC